MRPDGPGHSHLDEEFPNYDELARGGTESSDPDDDGVREHDDNCPGVHNPGQENTDRGFAGLGANVAEFGDACDPDIDGDGITNVGDRKSVV